MPTTRLMQFSPLGGRAETITEDGPKSVQPLKGLSSAHFLKLIEDRGQVGFWSLEFGSDNATVSVGLYRVLGIDPSIAVSYDDLINMTHPDDIQKSNDIKAALRSGCAIDREYRIIRPDGTLRWINNKAEVVVDRQGRALRAIGVITDITDGHSARLGNEEGRVRYNAFMKSMSVAELRSGPDGEILDWSGWFELTGQTEEKARSKGWLEVIHPDDRERVLALFVTSLGIGQTFISSHRILCADGCYHRFSVFSAPLIDTDGSIREWVGAIIKAVETIVEQFPPLQLDDIKLQSPHIRAARTLLNWTVEDLAREARVSVSSVSRLESSRGNTVRDPIIQSVKRVFMNHGVTFACTSNSISIHCDFGSREERSFSDPGRERE